ncbi:MAG: phosphotransferase [bacterium]|nr:phosphotransferase [bacterium]
MRELISPRGVFSDKHLPREWVSQKSNLEAYVVALETVCPGMRVISQLSRSTNTTTFVLQENDTLRVCQFGPPIKPDNNQVTLEEKYNPRKFADASDRLLYLASQGIPVPKILSHGEVFVADGQRQYIVMDFIKGISADAFLARHPHKRDKVYEEFGEISAKLSNVPYLGSQTSANNHLSEKVRHAATFLAQHNIFSLEQVGQLLSTLDNRLKSLGDRSIGYVHLDPFPINLHITGSVNNFYITLMDIEAFGQGHTLIEGLGRAIQWSIYDWAYISGHIYLGIGNTPQQVQLRLFY